MNFSLHNTEFLPTITFNNTNVSKVDCHKHLGVILSSDLSWKNHINSVIAGGNRKLGILKRCSHDLTRLQKIRLYLHYIRPAIEYGSIIYHGCTIAESIKLEHFQRRVALACTGAMNLSDNRMLMQEL